MPALKKLDRSMLPEVKAALETKTFREVGDDFGATGQAIIDFLKRNGIDHRQYNKQRGQKPRAVFRPGNDPLKALEEEAYESADDAEQKQFRDYSHIGPPVYDRPYRAGKLGEWPPHTDFLPDELDLGEHY